MSIMEVARAYIIIITFCDREYLPIVTHLFIVPTLSSYPTSHRIARPSFPLAPYHRTVFPLVFRHVLP